MPSKVPSVDITVRILERLARDAPARVTAGMLVRDLGLNRSTCYNVLTALEQAGWTTRTAVRGGWAVGPALRTLIGTGDDDTVGAVEETLAALSLRIGQLAYAARPDGPRGYHVTMVADVRQGVRVTVAVGDRFPVLTPALLHAVYAHLPPEELEAAIGELALREDRGTSGRDSLTDELARVRRRGYATGWPSDRQPWQGAAAPVFDAAGRPWLALGTLAFAHDPSTGDPGAIGRLLADAASGLTARLGGARPAYAPAETRRRA